MIQSKKLSVGSGPVSPQATREKRCRVLRVPCIQLSSPNFLRPFFKRCGGSSATWWSSRPLFCKCYVRTNCSFYLILCVFELFRHATSTSVQHGIIGALLCLHARKKKTDDEGASSKLPSFQSKIATRQYPTCWHYHCWHYNVGVEILNTLDHYWSFASYSIICWMGIEWGRLQIS